MNLAGQVSQMSKKGRTPQQLATIKKAEDYLARELVFHKYQ